MLDLIAIRQAVIAKDAAVVPELGDEGGGVGHGTMMPVFGSSTETCNHAVPRSGKKAAPSVVSNFSPAT